MRAHYTVMNAIEDLTPFAEVAQEVEGNQREPLVKVGGHARHSQPHRLYIDAYSAIKTDNINVMFQCVVKEGGDEPLFMLVGRSGLRGVYKRAQLDIALKRWRAIAAEA